MDPEMCWSQTGQVFLSFPFVEKTYRYDLEDDQKT